MSSKQEPADRCTERCRCTDSLAGPEQNCRLTAHRPWRKREDAFSSGSCFAGALERSFPSRPQCCKH
eukprot:6480789-Pyramimonas_sp.AAC.1